MVDINFQQVGGVKSRHFRAKHLISRKKLKDRNVEYNLVIGIRPSLAHKAACARHQQLLPLTPGVCFLPAGGQRSTAHGRLHMRTWTGFNQSRSVSSKAAHHIGQESPPQNKLTVESIKYVKNGGIAWRYTLKSKRAHHRRACTHRHAWVTPEVRRQRLLPPGFVWLPGIFKC